VSGRIRCHHLRRGYGPRQGEADERSGQGRSGGGAPDSAGRAGAGGQLAAPAEDVLASRLTDSTLTHALTDAALASRLVEEVLAGAAAPSPPPRARGHASALIPAGHGVLALTTFLLAVLAAVEAV
jgi:hypothetical protein